ncbi:hypothetical protein MESS2_1700019 [Mesorhizobium metallidurans STM 2683]|uniref:Uncharacterized protein n=1 Tax=Mesorhizobium metallidurans STM 2683 TaxID=1297569 RepID=M5ENJ5_9HYPH|nr:hypothetical protein MESS2_1700019 [Mesorhizobium metallidurans STM 2683]
MAAAGVAKKGRQQASAMTRASVDSSTSERALIPCLNFTTASRKVGWKMPLNLFESDRTKLLNEAIGAPNGDRDLPVPKKLYVVYEGAIYEAQTSDRGRTYHGYPYKGELSAAWISSHFSMLSPRTDEMLAAVG